MEYFLFHVQFVMGNFLLHSLKYEEEEEDFVREDDRREDGNLSSQDEESIFGDFAGDIVRGGKTMKESI